MRGHAKASSAGSTSGRGSGLGSIRRALAIRGGSAGLDGSGAPSAGVAARIAVAVASLVLLAVALAPASALATETRVPLGFSPITGAGTGVTLVQPSALAVDEANGNVFLNDDSSNTTDIFGAEGGVPVGVASPFQITGLNFIGELSGVGVDNSATSPSKGALYIAGINEHEVKKFVRNPISEQYEAAGELLRSPSPFGELYSLTVDKDGNVYVGERSLEIAKFSPTGTQLGLIHLTNASPAGMAVDSAGDLFVVSRTGAAYKYPANGLGEIEPAVFTQIASGGASGVAIDRSANRLFLGFGFENHIIEYDATTLEEKLEFGNGSLNVSEGLAVDSVTNHVYAANGFGAQSRITVFGTPVKVPTVTATPTTGIGAAKATLNGTVNPEGIAVTECKFEYGLTTAYTKTKPCEGAIPTDSSDHPVSANLAELNPNTTYHFRIVGTNANGTNFGHDQTFKTEKIATTSAATALKGTKATLNGTVRPEGTPITECRFEYGESAGYGFSINCAESSGAIGTGNTPVPVHADIAGLQPGTQYHFRLVAKSEASPQAESAEDRFFTTLGAFIGDSSVDFPSITSTSATVKALINPNGEGTSYRFEYVTQDEFEESGFAGAAVAPTGGAGIGHGTSGVEVSQELTGLVPATPYRVRVVATNISGTAAGAVLSFSTYPAQSFGFCSNQAFRTGPSANLPDCRAYEQASPVDKDGNDVGGGLFHTSASINGDAVTFQTNSGIPGGVGEQEFPIYAARRGASNWSTQGLLPPPSFGPKAQVTAWTGDLGLAFNLATEISATGQRTNNVVARNLSDGTFQKVFTGSSDFNLAGASADNSKVFFESTVESGGLSVTSGPTPASGKDNLYLWDRDTDALTLVGVLPADEGGAAPAGGSFAGPYDWWRHSNPLELARGGASGNYFTQDLHAISSDGDKVFFTAGETGQIYMREGLTGPSPETVRISASEKDNGTGPNGTESNGPAPAAFMAATPDGSKAFFTSSEELTNEANTGPEPPGPAIGRANLDGTGTNQSFIATRGRWVAVDGGHVYWTNPAANTIGRANIDGSGANPNFITGLNDPQGIAVDGTYVYWANSGSNSIGRATLDGTTEVNPNFVTGASNPKGIAVDGTYIYWANAGNTNIGRAELSGNAVDQAFLNLLSSEVPEGVAVNSTQIYWTVLEGGSSSYLVRANLNGSGETYTEVGGVIREVAANASNVFWTSESTNKIGRAGVNFSAKNESFIAGLDKPQGLALDGSHVYWSANQGTLPPSPGNDLYVYDVESGELSDLSVDNSDTNGAEVQGVIGTSEDGSYVYFAANGDLDGGGEGTLGNCRSEPGLSFEGACNLYLWHNAAVTFIAPLDLSRRGQLSDATNFQPEPLKPNPESGSGSEMTTSRVSADGQTIIFRSQGQLTDYEHPGVAEYYRFQLGDPAPICITCNPTGAPANGDPLLSSIAIGAIGFPTQSFLQRNFSTDGNRFFFETIDKLVPADTNGDTNCPLIGGGGGGGGGGFICQDVYEWEADGTGSCDAEGGLGGCLYLLSTGTEPVAAHISDASASGDDVFIFVHDPLVPQDQDQLQDVYDARVGGGLAAQHPESPPSCEGEGCRGAGTRAAPTSGAGTAVFQGPGNPSVKRHAKKPRHHKKRHHKRSHKRASHNRGGGK